MRSQNCFLSVILLNRISLGHTIFFVILHSIYSTWWVSREVEKWIIESPRFRFLGWCYFFLGGGPLCCMCIVGDNILSTALFWIITFYKRVIINLTPGAWSWSSYYIYIYIGRERAYLQQKHLEHSPQIPKQSNLGSYCVHLQQHPIFWVWMMTCGGQWWAGSNKITHPFFFLIRWWGHVYPWLQVTFPHHVCQRVLKHCFRLWQLWGQKQAGRSISLAFTSQIDRWKDVYMCNDFFPPPTSVSPDTCDITTRSWCAGTWRRKRLETVLKQACSIPLFASTGPWKRRGDLVCCRADSSMLLFSLVQGGLQA